MKRSTVDLNLKKFKERYFNISQINLLLEEITICLILDQDQEETLTRVKVLEVFLADSQDH